MNVWIVVRDGDHVSVLNDMHGLEFEGSINRALRQLSWSMQAAKEQAVEMQKMRDEIAQLKTQAMR